MNHGVEIDPFSAGSIEVVKGSAGVRYGPDAIAESSSHQDAGHARRARDSSGDTFGGDIKR